MAGLLTNVDRQITEWSSAHNPFFHGSYADLLALIPFSVLVVILYLTGRDILFAGKLKAK
jgi:hypothetical protein